MPSAGRKSEFAASALPSREATSGWNCDVTPTFSGPQQRGQITSGYRTPAFTEGRECYVTLAFLGDPNAKRGEKIRSGSLTPALGGLTPGRSRYVTRAFSGVPNAKSKEKIRIPYPPRTFSGARRWAELLCHPCLLGASQHQTRRENEKWLPHPSPLGGPRLGEIVVSPLHSSGSPTPSAGRK